MTTVATTHGMDKARVEPDWPPLNLEEVRSVLRRFPDCGDPVRMLFISPRPFSAAGVIQTSSGKVFVKRHAHSVRNREGLEEEHRFLAYLYRHGAQVPRVYATPEGSTAVKHGDWYYEVHETHAGVDLYEDALSWTPFLTVGHAYAAGAALARLHRASEGYDARARKARPLTSGFSIFAARNPEIGLMHYLAARPSLQNYLVGRSDCARALEYLAPFHAELLPLLPHLTPLWTHNDLHASNLLWCDAGDQAQVAAVIDFGLSDRTNAVYDLALAIERNMIEWLELSAHKKTVPVHLDQLQALLAGYESVRPLHSNEAAALAPMTALCHVEFALSETEYFWSILRSEEKALLASEGYLVGHARWFHSREGRNLLDWLKQWAVERESTAQKAACR